MKISVFSCFNSLPLAMPPHCNFPQIWTLWPHTYTYTHTHTHTQTTHMCTNLPFHMCILFMFFAITHFSFQVTCLCTKLFYVHTQSEKIWHRKLRKLTFTLKADNSSHCKQNKNLREYFFFFFWKAICSKEAFHIF